MFRLIAKRISFADSFPINSFLWQSKIFLRGVYIVNCTKNYFHIMQKMLKMEKMIRKLGEFTSISISC